MYVYIYICIIREYISVCWLCRMQVMLWDMIEGHKSCKPNALPHRIQDTTSIEFDRRA